MPRLLPSLALAVWLALPLQADPPPALTFDTYHGHEAISAALRWLVDRPGSPGRLRSIGKSLQGRALWMVEITDRASGPQERKIGVYVDGGTHGNEIASSEAALYLIRLLLAPDLHPALRELLRTHVFYVVPRVNPDAAELAVRGVGVRGNLRPRDDDRDGTADEDGPEDVNGDGVVAQMRIPDSRGRHVAVEGGYMERAGWLSRGPRYRLLSEGLDNDGDGKVNEDPPGGVDLNRDYPGLDDAGDALPAEPETRAVARFLLAHPNIATAQSLHTYGGVLFRPLGARRDADLSSEDLRVYDRLGKAYQRRTGNMPYGRPYGPTRLIHGSLLDYAYGRLGIYTLTCELWRPPGKDPRAQNSPSGGLDYVAGRNADRHWRAFNDDILDGGGTLPWTPFDHPTLGKVEIGGWRPFVRRNPPPSHLAEVCQRTALFILDQARHAACLAIRRARIEGGALRFEVVNLGRMPTFSAQAVRAGRYARDLVGIALPDGVRIAPGESTRRRFGPVPPGGTVPFAFPLRGRPAEGGAAIRILAVSEKAGTAHAQVAFAPAAQSRR